MNEGKPEAEKPSVYLQVSSIRETFRRAGFLFTKTPVVIACTEAQAKAIRAEHKVMLMVKDSSAEEFGKQPKSDAELIEELLAANASLAAKLDAADAQRAAIAKANADAAARVAELEGVVSKNLSRVAELEAALAKANADLDALTAPKAEPEPKSKPAKG